MEAIYQDGSSGPFVTGSELSIADVTTFTRLSWFTSGIMDGIPKDLMDEVPVLKKAFEATQSHEKIKGYYSK